MIEKKDKNGLTEREFLAQYNPNKYEKPSVTVDMICLGMNKELTTLKVLLIKRRNHPFIDCWALPGGFVEINESAYQAAGRELKEETGLENVYMEQVYTFTQPDRDPRMRVIDIAYMALMPITTVRAGDDAKEALWFDVTMNDNFLTLYNKEKNILITYKLQKKLFTNGVVRYENYVPTLLSQEKLAFDHAEIIMEGLLKLRDKVRLTDIAFNFVPKHFTLPDLQRVYEIILGKTLYKANFRKEVAGRIQSLGCKGKSLTGKKQAVLYSIAQNTTLESEASGVD